MSGLQEARAAYGGWLLIRGDTVDKVAGCRYLLQSVIMAGCSGRRGAHVASAVVDGLHALSMYGLAVVDGRRTRASLAAGVGASLFAAAEIAVALSSGPRGRHAGRRRA